MLILGSMGVTLVAMGYLENKEKIYINRNILYLIITILSVWVGTEIIKKIGNTFLLYI